MTTTNAAPDFAAIKAKQRQTWASGDYASIGTAILYMAETLCEALDLRAGEHVLDVAGGSGNAALAAARRFCVVTCTDYVPDLLERGAGARRRRAAAHHLRGSRRRGSAVPGRVV
jgi:cyclopropane fatty-acyl-phospholipid synthase-like methyltransferase